MILSHDAVGAISESDNSVPNDSHALNICGSPFCSINRLTWWKKPVKIQKKELLIYDIAYYDSYICFRRFLQVLRGIHPADDILRAT